MKTFIKPQQQAFEYAKLRDRIALFMEMRLGKTSTTIRWAEHRKSKKVLVLAPKQVIKDWVEELQSERYADEEIQVLKGSLEKRLSLARAGKAKWYIITYEAVLKSVQLLDAGWDCIVLDESTKIRNPQAKITKILRKRLTIALIPKIAILSGLPDPEGNLLDYFEQLRHIEGHFLGCKDYWSFRLKFFKVCGLYDWEPRPGAKKRIMEEVYRLAFVMTRKEAKVGSKKVYKVIRVGQNEQQIKLSESADKDFELTRFNSHYGEDTKWVPVKYQWLGYIAGGFTPHEKLVNPAKAKQVVKLAKGRFKNEKLVVWFKHTCELKYTCDLLNKSGVYAIPFYAGNTDKEAEFKKGSAQVICAQAKCGRFGKNWSMASTAIYYSNWYDGEVRAQSEDRLIHIKKKSPVLYIDLVTKGSIDEDVVDILKNKKVNSREFMRILATRWS